MIYIFWTCASKEEAKKIISRLIEKRLVACASIFPGIESIYRWEGKIQHSSEVKVILKTESKHFDPICKYILEKSSYKVPEIVQVEVSKANPKYLAWILEETN